MDGYSGSTELRGSRADGEIDYQLVGRSTWHGLPTTVTQSGLSARLDDSRVPKGQLRFRAVATDLAGNSAATTRLAGGSQEFVLRAPLRQATRLGISARHALRAAVRRCHHSGGHRRCTTTHRAPRRSQPRSMHLVWGHRKQLHGLLTTGQGHPIAGAEIEISLTPRLARATPQTTTVRTNRNGQFTYVVQAGPSRTIRVSYPGAAHLQPTRHVLEAGTSAKVTLSAHPLSLRQPGKVDLTGRVHGRPLPPGGKLVSLQMWSAHRWQTFATVHTDASGRFHYTKAIAHSPAGTYRLRASLPLEASFPYDAGASRVARVHVR